MVRYDSHRTVVNANDLKSLHTLHDSRRLRNSNAAATAQLSDYREAAKRRHQEKALAAVTLKAQAEEAMHVARAAAEEAAAADKDAAEAEVQATEAAAAESQVEATAIHVGAQVVVTQTTGPLSHLNDMVGVVVAYNDATGYFTIEMETSELVALRAQHLLSMSPAPIRVPRAPTVSHNEAIPTPKQPASTSSTSASPLWIFVPLAILASVVYHAIAASASQATETTNSMLGSHASPSVLILLLVLGACAASLAKAPSTVGRVLVDGWTAVVKADANLAMIFGGLALLALLGGASDYGPGAAVTLLSVGLLGLIVYKLGRVEGWGRYGEAKFSAQRLWRRLLSMDIWELVGLFAIVETLLRRSGFGSIRLHGVFGRFR